MLTRNIRIEEDLIDQLFNSSEKRLARTLLLLARYGKQDKPVRVVPKISQETLAEMVGTTRSRVNFFLNKFKKLGFIEYNGELPDQDQQLAAERRPARLRRSYELTTSKKSDGTAASLFDASRLSVFLFASLFTRLAPCRKRQRSQPRFRDRCRAFNTRPVRARLEPDERGVDAPHRLRPHLEQREIDVSLTVGVGAVDVVATLLRSVRAPVSNAVSNFALQFAPAITEHSFQMSTSSCGVGHR